jgi:hypothetical protein
MINRIFIFIIFVALLAIHTIFIYDMSFKQGKAMRQVEIITYCKADGVYLDRGLLLKCEVLESSVGKDKTVAL